MAYIASFNTTVASCSPGTVVCPNSSGVFAQCTHDNCPVAFVVSPDTQDSSGNTAIVQGGQVQVKTAFDLTPRTLVVSDGRGGVRAAASGEYAFVLGVVLSETAGAQVLLILRSFYGSVS